MEQSNKDEEIIVMFWDMLSIVPGTFGKQYITFTNSESSAINSLEIH
jgi:hypothetical protein